MRMDYDTCKVEFDGQVATVTIIPPRALGSGTADLHWDLGEIFGDLRGENDIRVVVLTGWPGEFYAPAPPDFYDNADTSPSRKAPGRRSPASCAPTRASPSWRSRSSARSRATRSASARASPSPAT
jgi:hypothetical protein